jgi:hypothetical protein
MITRTLWLVLALCLVGLGCDVAKPSEPVSASGVSKVTVKIPTGDDGLTTEQRNIRDRLVADNTPGSIKHLYVISAYSGQVLIYSTVRGKVTSGGKRLTPTKVNGYSYDGSWYGGFPVTIGDRTMTTDEVLQDDGSYKGAESGDPAAPADAEKPKGAKGASR